MAPARSKPRLQRTHKAVADRLKRADGHLRNVIAMLESGRHCVDVVQQMHAVIRALDGAKAALIHEHIDHCLDEGVAARGRGSRAALNEFKQLSRYL